MPQKWFTPGLKTPNVVYLYSLRKQCPNICPQTNSYNKNIPSAGDVDSTLTQSQRAATLIVSYPGGKTQFGNSLVNYRATTFLGKTEGQPGGINGPLRNKF